MKKVTLLAAVALFSAQGCKKCAECSGDSILFSVNGKPIVREFKHCDKNPYDVIGDTILIDNNTVGVDGKPTTIKESVVVIDCN